MDALLKRDPPPGIAGLANLPTLQEPVHSSSVSKASIVPLNEPPRPALESPTKDDRQRSGGGQAKPAASGPSFLKSLGPGNVALAPNHTAPASGRLSVPIMRRSQSVAAKQPRISAVDGIEGAPDTQNGNRDSLAGGRPALRSDAAFARRPSMTRRLSVQMSQPSKGQLGMMSYPWDLTELDSLGTAAFTPPPSSASHALAAMVSSFYFSLISALWLPVRRPAAAAVVVVLVVVLAFCGIFGTLRAASEAAKGEIDQAKATVYRLETEFTFGLYRASDHMQSIVDFYTINPTGDLPGLFEELGTKLLAEAQTAVAEFGARRLYEQGRLSEYQAELVRNYNLPLVAHLWLAPGARVSSVIPGPSPAASLDAIPAAFLPGSDLLASSLTRSFVFEAIDSNSSANYGPYNVGSSPELLEFIAAIKVPGASNSTPFVPTFPYPTEAECPGCRAKGFWGLVGLSVSLTDMYAVARRSVPTHREIRLTLTDESELGQPSSKEVLLAGPRDPMRGGQCTVAVTGDVRWRFCASTGGLRGRTVVWRDPVVAVVSFICLVLGVVFLLFQSRRLEYKEVLHSILPPAAIEGIRRGENIAEYYPNVTILFLDMCNFTSLSKEIGNAIELVRLLDELFSYYDDIESRYEDLYKLDQIGDCYMLASGCPYRMDPVEAARRCAHFALDLAVGTDGFTSSKGHKVQVRIGLNSGPVVGCVIGQKRPKYSVFGSTVNLASRMEHTSKPGMIQVTESTATLLKTTGEFVLDAAEADVKGIGHMKTFFVRRPDMAVSVDHSSSSGSSSGNESPQRANTPPPEFGVGGSTRAAHDAVTALGLPAASAAHHSNSAYATASGQATAVQLIRGRNGGGPPGDKTSDEGTATSPESNGRPAKVGATALPGMAQRIHVPIPGDPSPTSPVTQQLDSLKGQLQESPPPPDSKNVSRRILAGAGTNGRSGRGISPAGQVSQSGGLAEGRGVSFAAEDR